MSYWSNLDSSTRGSFTSPFGEPITYIPDAGSGDPITFAADGVSPLLAILRDPVIDQSTSPGYFADLDVNPADIPSIQRRDKVVWADGTVYVVNKVVNNPYGFTTLAIHLKDDK